MDYFPYGSPRLDEKSGSYNEKRKYIGQQYDAETQLSYLNARYYNGGRGQFVSQDPVFWSSKQNLQNPQSLNSYSYANDNPVNLSDPSGLAAIAQLKLQVSILQGIRDLYQRLVDNLHVGYQEAAVVGSMAASGPSGVKQAFQAQPVATVLTGVAFTASAGAAVLVGGAALGIRTLSALGSLCLFACPNAPEVGYETFDEFKKIMGPAGDGMQWHHIVEQTPNAENFAPEMIHSTENLVRVPTEIHWQISGFYSSKPGELGGLRFRDFVSQQSFSEQMRIGREILERFLR